MALNLRLPPELDLRLRKAAADRFVSLNTLVVMALDEYTKGVTVPSVVREPGKLFSEAESLAIAKSASKPVLNALAKPSKAERRAFTEKKRLARKLG